MIIVTTPILALLRLGDDSTRPILIEPIPGSVRGEWHEVTPPDPPRPRTPRVRRARRGRPHLCNSCGARRDTKPRTGCANEKHSMQYAAHLTKKKAQYAARMAGRRTGRERKVNQTFSMRVKI